MNPQTITHSLRHTSPALFLGGVALLAMSCATLLLPLMDVRLFQGVSVWLKPWKFQVSTGVYLLSLALFMVWLPKSALQTRSARYVVWVALTNGLFEVAYVTWQGALGQGSHFNVATSFHSMMYTLMGIGAVLLTSASIVLAILIARTQAYALPAALKLSIVLGLIITFVLGTGFGGYLSGQQNGHWVGTAATDAGGLPVVTWSRSGGDLRVAHFFGIHAMHFIPLFAFALHRLRVSQAPARVAVWVFSALFCALCFWTFLQALRGQPFWA
ncbi:hypothetical protein [Variovorax sp. PCZ-1]|uniref:hypothetical protein n=1 Tax=Variovorax sp. PCZ-1 TaxID=2835533 RepID=UPI001BD1B9F4|nr:hypothetical protein [Variovorax sp. PCZ-1]MBS7808770.1 hypothetical protein [Variovorax sp. PCZ-1]